MVTMKNIRIEGNCIMVDCYKEGKEDGYFSLTIDATSFEILHSTLDRPSIYERQAAMKIAELSLEAKELPSEAKAVWC